MKKIIVTLVLLLMLSSSAWATDWTLTPSLVYASGHYLKWQVLCTSNASALTATDIMAQMTGTRDLELLQGYVEGSTMMIMTVVPGTGTEIPLTTINITLTDDEAATIFSTTTVSKDAVTTGLDLSEDFNQYPTVYKVLNLALNDIGDAGDQVTLVFHCWREDIVK